MDDTLAVFTSLRPLLFSIAYRMLGSVTDAEDLVQETWLRWQQAPAGAIQSPRAYLTTILTRLAINELRSARRRREEYVGPWLPEPLMTEQVPDSSEAVELSESLSMAFLVLLERLSPIERAVLLLHEVFDLEHAEIARIIDKSEANCRQLLARARKHLGRSEPRFEVDPAQASRLMERFTEAATAGDVSGLVAVLADDVTLWADGGGKVRGAALRPLHGATPVARFVAGVLERFVPRDTTLPPARLNGQPGFVVYLTGRPLAALILDIRDERIHTIYAVGNPDKLLGIG